MPSIHLTRAEEMDKAFLMAKLFREPYYKQIIEILSSKKSINDEGAQAAFMKVYNNAFKDTKLALEADYANWLWNYLRNYDPKLSPTW